VGLFLQSVTIENFRGINSYSIDELKGWVSITGPNSTNKSAFINALSLLGSSKMHDISDILSQYNPMIVAPKDISVKVSMLFKLSGGFQSLVSDERVLAQLILYLENSIDQGAKMAHKSDSDAKKVVLDGYDERLKMKVEELKSKPLKGIMEKSLYDTIKKLQSKYPNNNEDYEYFVLPAGGLKDTDEVLKELSYLQIDMSLSHSEGPQFEYSLLNNEKTTVVSNYLFYHLLETTNSVDDFFFAPTVCSVFLKTVASSSFYKEEPISGNSLASFLDYAGGISKDLFSIACCTIPIG